MSFFPRWWISVGFLAVSFSQTALEQVVPAQTSISVELRGVVASVSSGPAFSSWRASHGRERADFAYEETAVSYKVDFTSELCVTSVAQLAAGFTRAASFYVPDVKRGALPPLPAKQDPVLTDSCLLGAVWYQASGRGPLAGIVGELTSAWGPPARPDANEISEQLFIEGSGLWKEVSKWHRGIVTIWLGWTDWNPSGEPRPRTIIWVVRDRSRAVYPFAQFNTTTAAAKIAGLDPALTAEVTRCPESGDAAAVGRLSRWLIAASTLRADRRAAALLVADSLAACAVNGGAKPDSLTKLGAKLQGPSCPQDGGYGYAGNFREQAEALDPNGPAGALAALEALQSPCSLKGKARWVGDQVIEQGQRILNRFPPGPWSPWVRLALAQAHEVKLSSSFPQGEADTGVVHPLTAAQARQERTAAITDLAQFIKALPASAEAVVVWKEAWRLMAGLSPNATYFGCGCE